MAFARDFRLGSIFKRLPARNRRDGRWLVVGLLGVLLTIAVPLAYSSLPDLSWIPGMYDDRDYDDVVVMLIDDVGLSNSGSKFQHVAWFLIGSVVCLPKRRGSWPALSHHTIRGPPNEPPGSMPRISLLPAVFRLRRFSMVPAQGGSRVLPAAPAFAHRLRRSSVALSSSSAPGMPDIAFWPACADRQGWQARVAQAIGCLEPGLRGAPVFPAVPS